MSFYKDGLAWRMLITKLLLAEEMKSQKWLRKCRISLIFLGTISFRSISPDRENDLWKRQSLQVSQMEDEKNQRFQIVKQLADTYKQYFIANL